MTPLVRVLLVLGGLMMMGVSLRLMLTRRVFKSSKPYHETIERGDGVRDFIFRDNPGEAGARWGRGLGALFGLGVSLVIVGLTGEFDRYQ